MPAWIIRLLPTITKLSWKQVLAIATWLIKTGNDRLKKNLTKKEREDLTRLVTKSKGRPSNLTERERTRVRRLVYKGAMGHFP